jgi:hypothetical protein
MLGTVAWLHVLVRKHRELGLACLAQSVNVVSTGAQATLVAAVARMSNG